LRRGPKNGFCSLLIIIRLLPPSSPLKGGNHSPPRLRGGGRKWEAENERRENGKRSFAFGKREMRGGKREEILRVREEGNERRETGRDPSRLGGGK